MTPRRYIIPIFIPHLGCPNQCVFCNQRRISGQIEPQTAETVRAAIVAALEKIPVGAGAELAFYGGSFTAIPPAEQETLLGAAEPFLRIGALCGLRLSTRPDCIDGETLTRLRRFGVETVELGVQSMCDDVLRQSGRGHTAADAVRAAQMLRTAGFSLILQMMTGLPGDTPERSLKTAEAFCALRPDGVRIYPTVVIRDTPLYDMWREGTYVEHTVEAAVTLCARLLDVFDTAGVPVIRLGLNPTDALSGGDAAAGAYHPAFGELVRSRRYLEKAKHLLRGAAPGEAVCLGVAPGQVSAMVGQRRCNIQALCGMFALSALQIREADVKAGEILRIPGENIAK